MFNFVKLFLVFLTVCVTRVSAQDKQPAGDDQAKQLFYKMESRLAKAKALECVFDINCEISEASEHGQAILLEGSLFLAEGNRARQEMNERTNGRPMFKLSISDGARWWWHDEGSPPHLVNSKPWASLNADYLTSLARCGLFVPTMPLPPVEAANSKERFPVSGFRLGPKEKVGKREAQRLEYQLLIKGQNGPAGEELPFPVTVWLDPKTSLPIKRVISQTVFGGFKITETYGKLVLDGEVSANKFEFPKVTKDTMVQQ